MDYWQLRRTGLAVVPPGAATPAGALGHLAAALEVALAVDAGDIPRPRHVVLPVGSTCTTAGLMLGFALAAARGLGPPPHLLAVRVTPWPITAPWRIRRLARRAAALLASLGGPVVEPAAVEVTGAFLGRGYGHATEAGRAAKATFAALGGPVLDTTYSAKAAACLLARDLDGPTLFWSTKSKALPPAGDIRGLPPRIQAWIAQGEAR
ncbi:MAG: pyridoxal-phosphate dependent enzyme [bacterium]